MSGERLAAACAPPEREREREMPTESESQFDLRNHFPNKIERRGVDLALTSDGSVFMYSVSFFLGLTIQNPSSGRQPLAFRVYLGSMLAAVPIDSVQRARSSLLQVADFCSW